MNRLIEVHNSFLIFQTLWIESHHSSGIYESTYTCVSRLTCTYQGWDLGLFTYVNQFLDCVSRLTQSIELICDIFMIVLTVTKLLIQLRSIILFPIIFHNLQSNYIFSCELVIVLIEFNTTNLSNSNYSTR